ncbi:hypothetical protein TL16_g08383 [Triparma laevis f. inornata]|uniref:Uncharacterized protein n=1 Tax=Triparma laevis f. inornata TaxID=1714386 RepID=A0A9W7AXW7_9STRA|nr:hypothetical protein TL16_g08383 [Triparma laevis f. inornata]
MSSLPPQTRKWGTDTYSKFDSITDLDSETLQSVTSTNFTLGSPPPPPPNLVDVMYASEKLKKRVLNVEKNNGVWAVDVLPLRLWSASVETGMEGRPYPVQPLTILLSTLYPKGQLLTYKINTLPSPESPPSNENVIELVINQILNPDYSPSYKPTKLVFTDSILYHELSHTIRGLDIEPCYVETHANGLIEYVETISKRLKKEGVGDYDEDCFEKEKLGFKGVPYFYETYKEILEKKIWEGFSVRQSFKMVTKDRTFYCCCLGSDGIYGLALFYSKLDLCTRFESAVSTLWKKSDRCFLASIAALALTYIQFTNSSLHFSLWRFVLAADGEASVIFKDCLHVSFKELDSIQKENYAVVNDRGCEAAGSEGVVYPIPVAIKSGQMKDVDERTFDDLIVAGGVFNSLERDSKLKEKLLDIKFEKNWEGIVEPQFETYGVEVDVGNGDVEKVDVTFDPVWTKSEVSGVLEQVAKKVEEGKKEEEQEEEEQVRVVQEAMDEAKIDDVKVGVGGKGRGRGGSERHRIERVARSWLRRRVELQN